MDLYRPVERLETEQPIRLLRPMDIKAPPYFRAKMAAPSQRHPDFKVDRFLWYCVVRGEEEAGVKWFMMPKSLHHLVIGQILALPIEPKLNRKEKFFRWCANRRMFAWVGLSKKLMKFVPQPTDCLDPLVGYDFIVRMDFKGQTDENRRGFPTYERSGFARSSKPAGTKQQIASWEVAMKTMKPSEVANLTLI